MDLNDLKNSLMESDNITTFIYPYTCHENEQELCRLELSSLLGTGTGDCMQEGGSRPAAGYIESSRRIEPGRSPYAAMRVDVILKTATLASLLEQAERLRLDGQSFKVRYLKSGTGRSYDEQRDLERLVGSRIHGRAEMKTPDVLLGLIAGEGSWQLGICRQGSSPWLRHKHKPSNYSTGLTATLARSLVNIAVPEPAGKKVIDPCCGMGNVLIEALSMGVDIVGVDINPLAVQGARNNLNYFGYDAENRVRLGDMNEEQGHYDASILDMPYNLCSVLPESEKRRLLTSLRRMSSRAVVVTTENVESELAQSGWMAVQYAAVHKGSFKRHIWLCEGK